MEFHVTDFFIHIVNIVLLFLLLRAFIYKPVSEFMAKREAKFDNQRRAIEREQLEVDGLKMQYQASLEDAMAVSRTLTEEKLEATERAADEIRAKARADAARIIEAARVKAETEHKDMLDDIKNETAALAVELAEILLAREVSEADNQALIDSFFEQVS